ncbi:unnamed protein product [Caenorhabditis auriculariae]|uniref:28S ribosomal protein S22, mitochondrial n=1 Tax=Caenorhabditis auriculariae TaxID=2777116 RepID=A0A8S1HBJ6_9PELO|nr:unnamed protein product [Caenorhabditis auriculariae]
MLKFKPLLKSSLGSELRRGHSAWVKTNTSSSSSVDVEQLFIDDEVQKLLTNLTEIDLENKVFRARRTTIQQRSHFALMTEERLEKTMERMREEARRFLQFVPVKEPRTQTVKVLSQDPDLETFDTSKFVFTDITFDATDQDRTVVVREPNGLLRTSTPEEHDRMNRTYYQKPNRPVFPPSLFQDPFLQDALDRNEHEFVLDWACWFYEPDDPAFIELSHKIFDRINARRNFETITSTRHFGPFVFYLALNENIPPLLNHFGGTGRIKECANLIRLQKTLRPDWRVTIAKGDSDEKIVKDYLKQNNRFRDELTDLVAFLERGVIKSKLQSRETRTVATGARKQATVNARNVRGAEGPLGNLSEEYAVKVVKSEGSEGGDFEQRKLDKTPQRRGRWQRSSSKPRNKNE